MSGARSRRKGANGEIEVGKLIEAAGFRGSRMGRNGYSAEDIDHSISGVHIEVKRSERLMIMKWIMQAERDALESGGKEPVVVFRQSREPWRAVVSFEWLLGLLYEHNARNSGV